MYSYGRSLTEQKVVGIEKNRGFTVTTCYSTLMLVGVNPSLINIHNQLNTLASYLVSLHAMMRVN